MWRYKSTEAANRQRKREATIHHNEKLLQLYNQRIQELNANTVDKGKKAVSK